MEPSLGEGRVRPLLRLRQQASRQQNTSNPANHRNSYARHAHYTDSDPQRSRHFLLRLLIRISGFQPILVIHILFCLVFRVECLVFSSDHELNELNEFLSKLICWSNFLLIYFPISHASGFIRVHSGNSCSKEKA